VLTVACDSQLGSVWLAGQLNVMAISGVTVNVAEQVLAGWQVVPSVSVHIIVVLPPQAEGARWSVLVSTVRAALHPPP
jgi:hypothetical protein